MAVLLDRSLVTSASDHYVEVETVSPLTRGMTVVDRLGVAPDPRNQAVWSATLQQARKCNVIWEINVSGWKQALMRALA
jgi:inosine-uridine nucleoside N-ribohydrolase